MSSSEIVVWRVGPRQVGVSVTVQRISEIDPAKQSFQAGLMVACEWLPSEGELKQHNEEPSAFDPAFKPIFQFMNAITADREQVKNKHGLAYSVLRRGEIDNLGRRIMSPVPYLVSCRFNVVGSFAAAFRLHNFPLDAQELPICIRSGQDAGLVEFQPHFRRKHFFKVSQKYSALAEWVMHKPLVRFRRTTAADSMFAQKFTYSVVDFCLKIRRRAFHTIASVVLPMLMLTTCSFACFVIDPWEGVADRLSLLFTLLLTLVAFKFIVQGDLPKVNHLTLLDWYINFSSLWIIFLVVESCIMSLYAMTHEHELTYTWVWAGSYLAAHVVFAGFSLWAAKREQEKLTAWAPVVKNPSGVQTAFLLSGDEYRVADKEQNDVRGVASLKNAGHENKEQRAACALKRTSILPS